MVPPRALSFSLVLAVFMGEAVAAPAPTAPPRKVPRRVTTPPARPGPKKVRPRPPRQKVPPPRRITRPDEGWRHALTEAQRQRLRQAGCRFDADDRRVADGLHARGFDASQLVAAWELVRRYGGGLRKHVPAAAAFGLLKISASRFQAYARSGLSLTDWYNRHHLGDQGRLVAGWVLTGTGIGAVALGVGLLLFLPRTRTEAQQAGSDSCGLACGKASLGGLAGFVISFGTAASLFAVGLPLLVDGYQRKKRRVKGQLLDTGTADEIAGRQRRAHLRRLHAPPRARLRVQPELGPGGGGLSLTLRF